MSAPLHTMVDAVTASKVGGVFASPLASQGFWHWAWFGDKASSTDARMADDTFMFLWWLSVFWFVLLMGLMVWFCMKWRRKEGVAAPRSPAHHTALEITWTIIPTLLLVVIFFKGFWDYVERIVARGDSSMIALTAQKWNWDMTYANGRVTTEITTVGGRAGEAKIFYVPEGSGIQLRMMSTDVIHSFWVPDWRIKCDVFPNRYTSLWFETEKLDQADPEILVHEDRNPGSVELPFQERYIYKDHIIYCAEYCGDFHSEMLGIIRVVPKAVYAAWVNDPGIDGDKLALWEIGQILHTTKGCSACHTVNGARGTGPTWDNAWGTTVTLQGGTQVEFDANYARTSIYTPGVQIHDGFANQMPVFTTAQINEKELGAIMAFMMHLADVPVDPAFEAEFSWRTPAAGATPPTSPAPAPTPESPNPNTP